MKFGRVKITAGFVLFWTIIVYMEAGSLFFPVWMTAMLHEWGHLAAVFFCGGKVSGWEFTAGGLTLKLSSETRLSYGKEIFCVLAGPAASMISALLFCAADGMISNALVFSGLCAVQGIYNLMPSMGLDGGRALRLLLEWRGCVRTPEIMKAVTLVTSVFLAVFGAVVFWRTRYNVTILFAGIYAIVSSFKGNLYERIHAHE